MFTYQRILTFDNGCTTRSLKKAFKQGWIDSVALKNFYLYPQYLLQFLSIPDVIDSQENDFASIFNKRTEVQLLLSGGKDCRSFLGDIALGRAFTLKHYQNDDELELCRKLLQYYHPKTEHVVIDLFAQTFDFELLMEDFEASGYLAQPFYLWIHHYQRRFEMNEMPLLSGGLGELYRNEYAKKHLSLFMDAKPYRIWMLRQMFSSLEPITQKTLIAKIENEFIALKSYGCTQSKNILLYLTRFALNAFVDLERCKHQKVVMPLASPTHIGAALKGEILTWPRLNQRDTFPFAKNGIVYHSDWTYRLKRKKPLESWMVFRGLVREWLDNHGYAGTYHDPEMKLKEVMISAVLGAG